MDEGRIGPYEGTFQEYKEGLVSAGRAIVPGFNAFSLFNESIASTFPFLDFLPLD